MLDYNSLNPVLEHASTKVAESRRLIQAEPPELLFHYTNSSGLRGILDSSRLWATHHRFLNDASELTYGMTLFESLVQERLAITQTDAVREFLGRTLHTANAFDGMFDCYISCFCQRDDLLNQWRVYANAGGGFALGFKTKHIGLRWGNLHPNQDFILRKVLYEEDCQRRLLSEILDLTIQVLGTAAAGASLEDANLLIARCCHFVRVEAAEYLMCFKHPAFSVEEEWRLCQMASPTDEGPVVFRDGAYGLTPYVILDPSPMAGVNTNKLPLAKITHGPTPNPSNVKFALDRMLRAKGYAFVEVAGSTLPMRVGG